MSSKKIAIFLSAFLVFFIQPLLGKYILPWFGGTPATWSMTLLFFQVLLTGGYAYAYWLASLRSNKRQGIIHGIFLVAAFILLVTNSIHWPTPITAIMDKNNFTSQVPTLAIFGYLLLSIGFPYFLLSTNGPLIQAWFSHAHPDKSPYPLYALSNAASLIALISYPLYFEVNFSIKEQAWIWSGLFLLFLSLVGLNVLQLIRNKVEILDSTAPNQQESKVDETNISIGKRLLWIFLPAGASIMLLAVTNQMTQEVAAIPFLWTLPLGIYLLTFIQSFSDHNYYNRTVYSIGLLVTSILFIIILIQAGALLFQIIIYSLLLYFSCMIFHGELIGIKPPPHQLTTFYLLVSIGGALGGLLVNFVAPVIFTGFWELEVGILLCWGLLVLLSVVDRPEDHSRRFALFNFGFLLFFTLLLSFVMLIYVKVITGQQVYASRNFYGVLRVKEYSPVSNTSKAYSLFHGITLHGWQYLDTNLRDEPTAYYTRDSGVGLAIQNHPKRPGALKIGVLGLGIGTLAAYGQTGDVIRFYEINPDVIKVAQGEGGYFSFLSDSRAEIQIVLGDARIQLQQELERGELANFDILVLDTFSSDSIPMHLITREAFELYQAHLAPQGIIAVHISNHTLDLSPVVMQIAQSMHIPGIMINKIGDGVQDISSDWILLSNNQAFLNLTQLQAYQQNVSYPSGNFRVWTDDYSNLFSVLKINPFRPH